MIEKKNVCEKILKELGNNSTYVRQESNLKGNYYAYLPNIIYLADSTDDEKSDEEMLVVICHESIHSMQNKKQHKANIALSNLELLTSFVLIILLFARSRYVIATIICYALILISSITIRVMLENEAVNKSFELARKIIKKEIAVVKVEEVNKLEEQSKRYIPLFYISLFWKKVVKIAFMIAVYVIMK